MVVSSWLCALVVAPFATFTVAAPTDVFYIIVFGIVQSGLAQTAYTIGVRYIPAAEASLLVALEVPLSPLLVWLVVNEVPTRSTQIGGAIALLALFSHMAIEFRSSRR